MKYERKEIKRGKKEGRKEGREGGKSRGNIERRKGMRESLNKKHREVEYYIFRILFG